MAWTDWMQRSLDLWLSLSSVFLVFVLMTVWRALAQIRSLRRRVEDLQGRVNKPASDYAGVEEEVGAASGDWVPRR